MTKTKAKLMLSGKNHVMSQSWWIIFLSGWASLSVYTDVDYQTLQFSLMILHYQLELTFLPLT